MTRASISGCIAGNWAHSGAAKSNAPLPVYFVHIALQCLRAAAKNLKRAERDDPGSTPSEVAEHIADAIAKLEAVFPPAFKERL
jgi:hypothetical protein